MIKSDWPSYYEERWGLYYKTFRMKVADCEERSSLLQYRINKRLKLTCPVYR
jgi:hypothetical protein